MNYLQISHPVADALRQIGVREKTLWRSVEERTELESDRETTRDRERIFTVKVSAAYEIGVAT